MRHIRLGRHCLPTPTVWLGHDIKNPFLVWETVLGIPGVILSANQVFERRWFREAATTIGVHRVLGFDGPIFLDSGGFQLQRQPQKKVSPATVLELNATIQSDIGAVLDYPLDPIGTARENRSRWLKTVRSGDVMLRHSNGTTLAPVLHAYSCRSVVSRLKRLQQSFHNPPIWCLGSLVPLFQGSHIGSQFANGGRFFTRLEARWRLITQLIRLARATINDDGVLHVFGAGSISTIFLLFLAGADSVDSAAWRIKASYGAIQLPGLADRFLETRPGRSRPRKVLTDKCQEILSQCSCPVCAGLTIKQRIHRLRMKFEARATHNAHVLVSEVNALREAKAAGNLADFVIARLLHLSPYRDVATRIILPILNGSSTSVSYARR